MPKFKTLFSIALFFLTLSSVFGQTTRARYVKATATGTMDGSTWANAMTLQAAIDGYMAADVLYLMSGSYTPTDSAGMTPADPRNATYVLPSGIMIYGGFAGTETGANAAAVLAVRALASIATTNETIIEGDIGTMRTSMLANNADNIKSLFTLADNARVTLNGLTVGRGKSTTTNGAGLLAGESVRLTIQWCRFIGNEARSGGAIYMDETGILTITNSHFEDNEASGDGGTIYLADDMSGVGRASITGSTFEENNASSTSDGIVIYYGDNTGTSSMTTPNVITRSSFLNNTAPDGTSRILDAGNRGILYLSSGANLAVSSSLFTGNAADIGSSMYSNGGGGTFVNNTVYDNRDRGVPSATVVIAGGSPPWVLANNIIYGNSTFASQYEVFISSGSLASRTVTHNLIRNVFAASRSQAGFDIANATPVSPLTAPESAANLFLSTDGTNANYLRLAAGVSAVNGGSNDYIDGDGDAFVEADATGLTDLADDPRINTTTVDAGAYEFRGSSITLTPVPADLSNLSNEEGTITVSVVLGGFADDYTVNLDKATFTTSSVVDGVLTLSYSANMTTSVREDTVAFSTTSIRGGEGPARDSLFLRQMASVPPMQTVGLTPDNLMDIPAVGGTRTVMLTLGGGATSYMTSGAADWVTVPAMGMAGEVSLNLDANTTTSARQSMVTFTPTGGTDPATPTNFMISQLAAPAQAQRIVLTPVSFDEVPAVGTTLTVMVDLEGGATGFTATTTNDWITVPAMGDGESPIMIMVDANSTMDERDGEVRFAPTGGSGGVAVNLPINQSAPATIPTIMLDPSTIDAMAAGGDETVVVLFSGGATAYSVPTSGVGAPQSWVTVPASSTIDADDEITVTLLANPSRRPRYDTVYFMPTTGMGREGDDTLNISQAGAVPTGGQSVTLLPTTFEEVVSVGDMIVVEVSFGGGAMGYTVPTTGIGAPASWVTVPASSTIDEDGLIEVTIAENTGAMERKDTVYFAPTGGSGTALEDTLYITQLGTVVEGPSVTLNPSSVDNVPAVGGTRTVNLTLGGGATGYTTSGVADWVTVPAMGMAGEVSLTLDANTTTSARQSMVTFTPTGGAGTRTDATLTITQLGVTVQTIRLAPDELDDVPAVGRTRTVRVTLGGGATGYTTSGGAYWVSVPARGSDGDVVVTIQTNTLSFPRSTTITFIPTGGRGTAISAHLTITQLGEPAQTIRLAPDELDDVPAVGRTRTVRVTLGGGATGYTTSGGAYWVSVPARGSDGDVVVTIQTNTTTSARSAMITFIPTGGRGMAISATLTINQLATPPQTITFTPSTPPAVSAAMSNVTAGVMFGGGATGFTVPSSGTGAPASWLTVPATLRGGNLVINVTANTGVQRSSDIVFTPTGGSGTATSTTLTITQQGATSTISFTPTTPPAVVASGGNVTVGVMFGGGATGFTVPSSGTGTPASWLTVPATLRDGNLVINVTANTGVQRSSDIVFTPTGGSGTATATTLTITQQEATSTITFTPATPPAVVASGGNVTVGVMFGGGATGFTVPSSGTGSPANWLTVPATLRDGNLVIAVTANIGVQRSSDIVFTPTGGSGTATATTLTITQQEATSTITFTPATPPAVVASGGNVAVGVMFGGDATGFTVPSSGTGAPASWLTVPATLRDGNLVIAVTANTGVQRSSDIVFTPTGGSGTATATTLTITQQEVSVMSFGVRSSVFTDIRVVNPVSDELVIYGLSVPVRFGLRDVSGGEVFSVTLLASATQRILLPPLAHGAYILTLESQEGEVYNVRLLRE